MWDIKLKSINEQTRPKKNLIERPQYGGCQRRREEGGVKKDKGEINGDRRFNFG